VGSCVTFQGKRRLRPIIHQGLGGTSSIDHAANYAVALGQVSAGVLAAVDVLAATPGS